MQTRNSSELNSYGDSKLVLHKNMECATKKNKKQKKLTTRRCPHMKLEASKPTSSELKQDHENRDVGLSMLYSTL